jgi:hypothetical protein
MIESLRPALVDTLSPGADDGPTGRSGSAGTAYGSIMGETPDGDIRGHSVRLPEPVPGAPVLRLRLFSIIGGLSVRPR